MASEVWGGRSLNVLMTNLLIQAGPRRTATAGRSAAWEAAWSGDAILAKGRPRLILVRVFALGNPGPSTNA